ncbi:MAG: DUF4157 domain-containing protein [Gallionella sp.]|nr:DUF4157 domain-containing protein [Gallionella sp.]
MEQIRKQDEKSASSQRTAQAKFTSKSGEGVPANGIDDSPLMVAQRKMLQSLFGGAVQRQAAEEEMLQGKFDTAQRVEDDESLQGKFAQESVAQLKEEPAAKSNNTGLPDNLKSGIESLSGMSMDDVKVHYNSSQPAQLNALAYAQGADIHVAPGQERHLPHEAWHVVQQAQGRVKPTMQMKDGVSVNDDKGLEQEADSMGAKAVQMKNYRPSLTRTQTTTPTIQRALHHYQGAPFTAIEAAAWNNLVVVANGFGVGAALIASTEIDVFDVPQVVTVPASITGLKAIIRAHILTRQRNRQECDNFDWGDFAPHLALLAASYGAVTGPVVTGGHAANVYTYTAAGVAIQIAEETNSHGRTVGNLNTRRGTMRTVIDQFNLAAQAHANQYV